MTGLRVVIIALAAFLLTGQLVLAQVKEPARNPHEASLDKRAHNQLLKAKALLAACNKDLASLKAVPAKRLTRKDRKFIKHASSRLSLAKEDIKKWENKLNSVDDRAESKTFDLQNTLSELQKAVQMLSTLSKKLHDTESAVSKKIE
jgi:chromosome segregation ATPase